MAMSDMEYWYNTGTYCTGTIFQANLLTPTKTCAVFHPPHPPIPRKSTGNMGNHRFSHQIIGWVFHVCFFLNSTGACKNIFPSKVQRSAGWVSCHSDACDLLTSGPTWSWPHPYRPSDVKWDLRRTGTALGNVWNVYVWWLVYQPKDSEDHEVLQDSASSEPQTRKLKRPSTPYLQRRVSQKPWLLPRERGNLKSKRIRKLEHL